MNEAAISRKIKSELLGRGAWMYKASDRFHACLPDLIGCYYSAFIAIEMKVFPNKPTQGQLFELEQIHIHGGHAFLVTYHKDTKKYECVRIGTCETSLQSNQKDAVTWLFSKISLTKS